jgi:hypothetical protein
MFSGSKLRAKRKPRMSRREPSVTSGHRNRRPAEEGEGALSMADRS